MSERKGGLFRAYTGWIERNLSGNKATVNVHHGENFEQFEDAMEEAKYIEGWVERDGQPAHVKNKTKIKLT